jgi:transposase
MQLLFTMFTILWISLLGEESTEVQLWKAAATTQGMYNLTPCAKTAAMLCGVSPGTVHKLFRHWVETGEVEHHDQKHRGGGSKAYEHGKVDPWLQKQVADIVYKYQLEGTYSSVPRIQESLVDQFGINLAAHRVRYVLVHKLGFRFGRGKLVARHRDPHEDRANKRLYVLKHQEARILEKRGEAVLVYTDESYVNTTHARKQTWFDPKAPTKNEIVGQPGKGERLIILHAITKDGFLVTKDADGKPIEVSEDDAGLCDRIVLSTELVFQAKVQYSDYHQSMNADAFMAWFEYRLCPTFEALYPEKRMILVLDNAAYHRARHEDYVNPKAMKREELAEKLDEFAIDSVPGVRTDENGIQHTKLFPPSTYHAGRGGKNAPTVDEMVSRLDMYLAGHPELQ